LIPSTVSISCRHQLCADPVLSENSCYSRVSPECGVLCVTCEYANICHKILDYAHKSSLPWRGTACNLGSALPWLEDWRSVQSEKSICNFSLILRNEETFITNFYLSLLRSWGPGNRWLRLKYSFILRADSWICNESSEIIWKLVLMNSGEIWLILSFINTSGVAVVVKGHHTFGPSSWEENKFSFCVNDIEYV
jgi:hypothetical protein